MGSLSDFDLRREAPRLGESELVGSAGVKYGHTTATEIVKLPSGLYEYGEESEIQVWPYRFLEVPIDLDSGLHLYWCGMEIKTKQRDWADHSMVVSIDPPSYNWYAHSPFRSTFHGAKEERAEALRAELSEKSTVAAGLRGLPFDPFEKDSGYCVARIDDPHRIHWENGTKLGEGFLLGRNPNWSHNEKSTDPNKMPQWFFGACKGDPETLVQEIYWSKTCESIIDDTLEDKLFDNFWMLRPREVTPVVQQTGGDVRYPRLFDSSFQATDRPRPVSEAARELMDVFLRGAIWQSLAGRVNGSGLTLAEHIRKRYLCHIENFIRREMRQMEKLRMQEFLAKFTEHLQQGAEPIAPAALEQILKDVPKKLAASIREKLSRRKR